jgi:Amt family ammonium transporter
MNELMTSIDTVWVLFATTLVFFMQAGFAMVETGFTRAKNAGNIIMKNIMDFSVGSVMFWVLGFGLMFGTSVNGFIGIPDLFVKGTYDFGIPTFAFLIFQTVFCATAATIVSGAMAERTKFVSYLVYSVLISGLIYPVVGHWIWGGGWLSELGFHDFAGSTVVHSIGGWAALIGAKILGPRIGKFNEDGTANTIPGHSLTLGALGVFILWFGWFGFNPGSQLAAAGIGNMMAISKIFITTNLAAALAAICAMFYTWIRSGKPDVGMTLNGALAGLVAITAGCDVVSPMGAAIIGACAGVLVVVGSGFVEKVLKIDDPVGAVAVHGINGAFGTLMVGVFAESGGLLYGGGGGLLAVQATGVAAVLGWTVVMAFLVFKGVDSTIGLRVTNTEENIGLDLKEHGAISYADFALKEEA